jgi:bromodomain-containing factor 1
VDTLQPPPPPEQAGPSSFRSQGSVPAEERTRRPSISQPTIRRNPSDDYGTGESSRPKREIHPPTPKDSTWVEPIPQVAKAGKGRANSSPRMKAASRAINDLLTKQKYKMAAHPFYMPVGECQSHKLGRSYGLIRHVSRPDRAWYPCLFRRD